MQNSSTILSRALKTTNSIANKKGAQLRKNIRWDFVIVCLYDKLMQKNSIKKFQ